MLFTTPRGGALPGRLPQIPCGSRDVHSNKRV
jgi:hypothetical protein